MEWHKRTLEVHTSGKGMVKITAELENAVRQWGVEEGILHIFIQHTSASIVASESYDPSAQQDLEAYMEHIAPENQTYYRHTLEGSDDSPSHIRSMLTNTSLSIPIDEGKLNLGTWQGIFLFEHRRRPHRRKVLLRCLSVR
ncbi:MAG: YjbQ family protein [Anaerolineales bacterium]|nr:YjbQ family protein [Anaerolineales bacterium]